MTAIQENNGQIEVSIEIEKLRERKLFLAAPMYGGQCLQSEVVIDTSDGLKTIKEIVDKRYSGNVKSLNLSTGQYEWKRVLDWRSIRNGGYKKPETKKTFIKVKTDRGNHSKHVICTTDHRIAVIKNPLLPEIGFMETKDTLGQYIVRDDGNLLFNDEQLSAIIGMLLGDGSIKKSGAFTTSHGSKQREYLEYICGIVGGNIRHEIKKSGYGKESFVLSTPVNAQTKHLRDLMYSSGRKKIDNIIEYIDEKALAFWYMDDGYLLKERQRGSYVERAQAMLCTDGFTKDECDALCQMFMDKWGIKASTIKYRTYYRIAISKEGSLDFWRLISPFMHKSMLYKFPDGFNDAINHEWNNIPLEFSAAKITGLPIWKKSSKLYDIEVEDNHNFIANGSLVHNCAGMFCRSVMDLAARCTSLGITLQVYYLFNESLITRARNYCADEFLRSDCTHMMFIDSDIGFNPDDVLVMLSLMGDDSDYDVMAGPYPKKCISWEKVKQAADLGFADDNPNNLEKYVGDYVFNPKMNTQEIPINKPVEVLEAGTGFMMIRRKTFEKYKERFPELSYRPDHVRTEAFDGTREIMAYFDCIIEPETKRYLSEDYMFCYNVQKAGMKVWFCPWMKLSHVGTYVFSGSLADLAQIGASATADISKMDHIKKRNQGKIAFPLAG